MSRYAVKLVNHSKEEWGSKYSKPTDLKMEVEVLEKVDHPCVVKVVDVVETDTLLAIVMEYASGGELFDQVIKDESQVASRRNSKVSICSGTLLFTTRIVIFRIGLQNTCNFLEIFP